MHQNRSSAWNSAKISVTQVTNINHYSHVLGFLNPS